MDDNAPARPASELPIQEDSDARGIVIADGGLGQRAGLRTPVVRAFIYGEESPDLPTLPFGRWKEAS